VFGTVTKVRDAEQGLDVMFTVVIVDMNMI
jgi:hypothetical protein